MISVAVIGAGYWATNMLRVINESPNTRLIHVADLSESALANVKSRYPGVNTTTDVESIFNDSEVEAIYIATPPATHYELAKKALRSGKHVLVEKPITTVSTEAGDLIELAALHGRTLMTGHTFLYSPPVMKVKELIDNGTVGDVFYIDAHRVNLGKYQDSGVMWDLAPHDLSIIMHWLGEAPISVSATGRSFVSSGREDVVFLSFDFPSGAVAQIHVSWLSPVKLRRTTLSGSKNMVVYDDTAGPEAVKVYDHGVDRIEAPASFGEFQLTYRQGDVWSPRLETTEPLRGEWEHFITCCETGQKPRSSGEQGLWTVKALEAADRSLQSGKREDIQWTTGIRSTPRERFAGIEIPSTVK